MSAAKPLSPTEELILRDGLGDRLLARDSAGRPSRESLLLRAELSGIPAFEFALNERAWMIERFRHASFLTISEMSRASGPLPVINLGYETPGGARLSQLLDDAESGKVMISAGAAAFVVTEILNGVAALHRQSGELSHAALAPERIVLGGGRVRIADYILGSAIEALRFSPERYWKELRVAVPPAAGGTRLDRRVDVAQIGMIAVALFAGRRLRDDEHVVQAGDVVRSLSVPEPVLRWLHRTLHMDPRRVFVHAGDAAEAWHEAVTEAGLTLAPEDLALEPPGGSVRPAAPRLGQRAPAATPVAAVPAPPLPQQWPTPETEPARLPPRGSFRPQSHPASPGFKRFFAAAMLILLMTTAFTVAQYLPEPDQLFSRMGTLVIESNPQGVQVFVNGRLQGQTPLTLRVEGGRHEVELRGPGKPKIFNVFVSRGDRVAQYVEFSGGRPR